MGIFFLRYCAIVAAVAAACYSVIVARAAHLFALDTGTSVPAAVKLVPYHAGYTARLAALGPAERDRLQAAPWN